MPAVDGLLFAIRHEAAVAKVSMVGLLWSMLDVLDASGREPRMVFVLGRLLKTPVD